MLEGWIWPYITQIGKKFGGCFGIPPPKMYFYERPKLQEIIQMNNLKHNIFHPECSFFYIISRTSPKCYKCPKKHVGPTIWFHSIKLKLFKLIFINWFNDLFLLFSKMTVLRNQNKARREEPESWISKSFNLIEWNQIVGPVCFLGHLGDALRRSVFQNIKIQN